MARKKSQFNKTDYDMRYRKGHIRQISLSLNKIHDADIIAHLEKQHNMTGYLKRLIREDIQKK